MSSYACGSSSTPGTTRQPAYAESHRAGMRWGSFQGQSSLPGNIDQILRLNLFQFSSVHESLVRHFLDGVSSGIDNSLLNGVLESFHKLLDVDKWREGELGRKIVDAYASFFKNGNLSNQLHQQAFNFCAQRFSRHELHAALPWIANHKEFSADDQLRVWSLLNRGESPSYSAIYVCASIPHATPELKSRAMECMFDKATKGDLEARNQAISKFPSSSLNPELPRFIEALNQILLDLVGDEGLRAKAALRLCEWLNARDRPAVLSENVLKVMRVVESLIRSSESNQKLLQAPLFSSIWKELGLFRGELINLYERLLSDEDFPIERKELLACSIPLEKMGNVWEINRFIIAQLENSSISQDLKKVLTKHLIFSAVRDHSSGPELRMGLELIQKNPVLLHASRQASDLDIVCLEKGFQYHPYVSTVGSSSEQEEVKVESPLAADLEDFQLQVLKINGGHLGLFTDVQSHGSSYKASFTRFCSHEADFFLALQSSKVDSSYTTTHFDPSSSSPKPKVASSLAIDLGFVNEASSLTQSVVPPVKTTSDE